MRDAFSCFTFVSDEDAARLRQGRLIRNLPKALRIPGEQAALDGADQVVAVCEPDESGEWLRPVKVLPKLSERV